MAEKRGISAGGKRYTETELSDGSRSVRRGGSFGPKVADTKSTEDTIAAIKEDSGAKSVKIKKP